jgi:hypothetical protein
MGEEHYLCSKLAHGRASKKHCTLIGESLKLEARWFSHLLIIVYSVSWSKEYGLPVSVFMDE